MAKITDTEKLLSAYEGALLADHRLRRASNALEVLVGDLIRRKAEIEEAVAKATQDQSEVNDGLAMTASNLEEIRQNIVEVGGDLDVFTNLAQGRIDLLIKSNIIDPAAPVSVPRAGRGRPRIVNPHASAVKDQPTVSEEAVNSAVRDARSTLNGEVATDANAPEASAKRGRKPKDTNEDSQDQVPEAAPVEADPVVDETPAADTHVEPEPVEADSAVSEQQDAPEAADADVAPVPTVQAKASEITVEADTTGDAVEVEEIPTVQAKAPEPVGEKPAVPSVQAPRPVPAVSAKPTEASQQEKTSAPNIDDSEIDFLFGP